LSVTFTNDREHDHERPCGLCEHVFSMPSLTGITATGEARTATTSPTTDSWTS